MAIEYKRVLQVRERLNEQPFNNDEVNALARLEDHIDTKILANVDSDSFNILLTLAQFNYNPKNQKPYDFREARKVKLQKLLENNYREAGWKISIHIDDGLDGPNMSGSDYWILTPKNKKG